SPLSIAAVWRYPVKGLGGELLSAAEILPERGIAGDRRWLLAAAAPAGVAALLSGEEKWRPWNYGLTLKKDARLAFLRASLRGEILTIDEKSGGETICCDMETEDGREAADEFLRGVLKDDSVYLADCESRPVWDDKTPLTALFCASVADLSEKCGVEVVAERFRANIVLDGGAAWDELNRGGGVLRLEAEVKLAAVAGVERCAATRVNPKNGARDINVPESLVRHYSRNTMGIHCGVMCGGKIIAGGGAVWE
ncbi:MAG: MOSC domain-containing protein, partial [Betaproteobacteria bacterium]|nr:MOSC domain-containing protein [Betaproteobacteria bacterium]